MSEPIELLRALRPHEFYALVRMFRVWFTPMQAAAYLGVKARTLESWRAAGKGPKFRGEGKLIRYNLDELDRYIAGPSTESNNSDCPSSDKR